MPRTDYIARLQEAILTAHGCKSIHTATMHVVSTHDGQTVWDGDVEVFDLDGHLNTKKCYAWARVHDGELHPTTILELAPVHSPATAVDAALLADYSGS